jgi:formylmethanofuran dehydrogenase subunit A
LREIRSATGTICIRNVSVIDPVREEVLPGMDILIRDGIIQSVNPTGQNPEEDIQRSATIEGAKALQQEDRIGTIGSGKEADIVLIPTRSFEMQPITDDPDCLANLIVNSAESRDIFAVLADGRIRVWNHRLVDEDEGSLARRVTQIRRDANSRSYPENKGREWREEQTLAEIDTVIRYRSMYPNYTTDVTYENGSSSPIEVSIVLSDTEKAGGLFFAEETKSRFPYQKLFENAQIKTFRCELSPGSVFNLKKDPGGKPMKFIISSL